MDPTQAFNSDDFIKDSGGLTSQKPTDGAPTLQVREKDQITVTWISLE